MLGIQNNVTPRNANGRAAIWKEEGHSANESRPGDSVQCPHFHRNAPVTARLSPPENTSPLGGRVAIVTGAGSGIGASCAQRLAELGASVVVVDRREEAAAQVASDLSDAGHEACSYTTDVGQEAEIATLMDAVFGRFGRIDVLHNNAAALGRRTLGSDTVITEASEDMIDETLRVNLKGVIWGCKHAIPKMLASGGGSIINTSSVLAQRADAQRAVYAASKAGVEAITRSVAAQFGRQGIRCNAVAPGFVVSSPGLENSLHGQQLIEATLVGRPTQSGDLAAIVAFLASDESRNLTGQVIAVDGGHSVAAPWGVLERLQQMDPS